MKLRLPFFALIAGIAGVVATACGSNDESLFGSGDGGTDAATGGQNNQDGTFSNDDAALDPDAYFANDPQQLWCGPDGGAPDAAAVTGTVDCPSDKNREGCPCSTPGEKAACWPGYRKNRNMGICKDGTTTCVAYGEVGAKWGACEGDVLPVPGAKFGKDACGCFSQGQWKIENLTLSQYTLNCNGVTEVDAFSRYQDSTGAATGPDPDNYPQCPTGTIVPPKTPTQDWSKDTLQVDCAGKFTLSYTIRAGDFNNPKPTDCVVHKVTLPETEYPVANVVQPFPNLPGWMDHGNDACYTQFFTTGGYGEMSVKGQSVTCDAIDDGSGNEFVFNRIQYCKPNDPNCGQDGSGVFH